MRGRHDTATKLALRAVAMLAVVAFTACRPAAAVSEDDGAQAAPAATEADRAALFDFLVESTLAWDAFASLPEHPYYRAHPKGLDVRAEMRRHR
jgi:hypothetical protein